LNELIPIPLLPEGLLEAAQRGTLIPFIGAGVSRLAGCPGWNEFADGALRFFVNEGKFSHGQLAQISHLNARVKLSIAKGLQDEHDIPIKFEEILQPSGWQENAKGKQLYESLSKLGKTFVTTNYDEWLHKNYTSAAVSVGTVKDSSAANSLTSTHRTIIHKVSELTPANLNRPNTVIHLHGWVGDPQGMIMTTQDYVRHYANDRLSGTYRDSSQSENRLLTFLEYLFKPNAKTILFIGYGLEELEILEYVILKARHNPGIKNFEARHYLLHGFYSHEEQLMKSLSRYFLEECGIEMIPFLRDQKDWDQLIDVLNEFARQAPASNPLFIQQFKEMEDLLNE
jgi:hypothetical protein